ncbi:protein kinase domain containing protein [Theileria equi strain WA]|uniref:non-specific serine/threonine protein kinase n=1 Tax=Theileria equi strain WA TaxID=1537102 RepID=L0AZG5_THEEQ|nr:protein kinase domain containing protein [Theileria equi strain WA]AFZ80294.1 protein kinase domain containing protein [Theileria equi strain WA]|eukprot:XP_004829960.1 protein kinase domain containing protein [Theileria equi strain WA]
MASSKRRYSSRSRSRQRSPSRSRRRYRKDARDRRRRSPEKDSRYRKIHSTSRRSHDSSSTDRRHTKLRFNNNEKKQTYGRRGSSSESYGRRSIRSRHHNRESYSRRYSRERKRSLSSEKSDVSDTSIASIRNSYSKDYRGVLIQGSRGTMEEGEIEEKEEDLLNEDDDIEAFLENRRKQRQELLKKHKLLVAAETCVNKDPDVAYVGQDKIEDMPNTPNSNIEVKTDECKEVKCENFVEDIKQSKEITVPVFQGFTIQKSYKSPQPVEKRCLNPFSCIFMRGEDDFSKSEHVSNIDEEEVPSPRDEPTTADTIANDENVEHLVTHETSDTCSDVAKDLITSEKSEASAEVENKENVQTNAYTELQRKIMQDKLKLRNFVIKMKEQHDETLDEDGQAAEEEEEDDDDDVDMFSLVTGDDEKSSRKKKRVVKPRNTKGVLENRSLAENWNDSEGYYQATIGEMLNSRYRVLSEMAGKGVFSSVLECFDLENNVNVAIKIIRNNDMMIRAAEKEMGILKTLNESDTKDKRNIVRLLDTFEYRGHFCMVFQWLWGNLRTGLKRHGKGHGLRLSCVRSFAKKLFVALWHLKKCKVMHADLKPDNILVDEGLSILKVCDLGSASDESENDITAYLVSRFYRAPEIILGCKYDCKIDTWSAAVTLYEIATGEILFPGRTNNHMLKLIMEFKGKVPGKMIKSGQFAFQHFNEKMDFIYVLRDNFTRMDVTQIVQDLRPTRSITESLIEKYSWATNGSGERELMIKKIRQLGDLLEKALVIDPLKRITPDKALEHPFIREACHF